MEKLIIDPEFRDKIPAMPKEDFDGLRSDIIRDGYVRDPLVVWDEENTLLDGHHRWRVICENWELLKDKYTVDRKSFPDRWAAIAWICANQLHKHNMTELQRMKLYQEEYEARQHSEQFKGNQYTAKSGGEEIRHHQAENLVDGSAIPFEYKTGKEPKTREILAKEHNVSPGTIQTAVEVGRGIDKAAAIDPEFKREILSGEVKARKTDLAALRKLETPEEVAEAIAEIRNPTKERKPSSNPQGFTKEQREQKAKIAAVVADMYDPTTAKEFTVDDLVNDIRINAEAYVNLLRNTLADRNVLLTAENRPIVAEAITKYVMNEIEKVRDLVK